MAACSNRYPSPMSSRPSPNPNPNANSSPYPRNQSSEKRSGADGGHRRSFSGGSPFKKPAVVPHSKSWSFSCKTSANSSGDFSRRTSTGRENALGSFRDYDEHKENENNPNVKPSARSRSSSVPRTTSKHFMCPTISAVSKVTPSSKKKVLAERNDSIRASASLSDGKFLFFTSNNSSDYGEAKNDEIVVKGKMDTADGQNQTLRTSVDDEMSSVVTTADLDGERCEFSSQMEEEKKTPAAAGSKKKVRFDDDLVMLSTDFSLAVSDENPRNDENATGNDAKGNLLSPSLIAPLDADPVSSCAPYDPITNYLSPRPQFLRYKPDPLTEIRPEDSCSSETASGDSDETTGDETQSEEISDGAEEAAVDFSSSVEVQQPAPCEDSSVQEPAVVKVEPCEDSSVQEPAVVKVEPCKNSDQEGPAEVKVEPSENSVAEEPATEVKVEPCPYSIQPNQHVDDDSTAVKTRVVSKPSPPRFFSVSKAISLLLLLFSVAFLSVTWVNPPLDESGGFTLGPYQKTFSVLYQNPHQFGEFARQSINGILHQARQSSVQFMNYVSVVLSHGEVVKFNNLTSLDEKYNNHLVASQSRIEFLNEVEESNTDLVMDDKSRSINPQFEEPAPSSEQQVALSLPTEHEDSKPEESFTSFSSSPDHEHEAMEHSVVLGEGLELTYLDAVEQTPAEIETTHPKVEQVQDGLELTTYLDADEQTPSEMETTTHPKVEQVQETDKAAAFVHPTEPVNDDLKDSHVDEQTTFNVGPSYPEREQIHETNEAAAYLHPREPVNGIEEEHIGDTIGEEAHGAENKPDVDSNLDTGNQGLAAASASSMFEVLAEYLQFLISQIPIEILLSMPVLAATGFILTNYLKSKKVAASSSSSSSLKGVVFEKPRAAEKSVKDELPLSTNSGRIEEVVDMNDESCPPGEMSSFQRSSFSYNRTNKGATAEEQSEADSKGMRAVMRDQQTSRSYKGVASVEEDSEADSKEMRRSVKKHQQGRSFNNTRRESLASSSSEFSIASASYGSFTTYSIRPSRHGEGEVTPVRRSSRIRSKGGSP